MAGELGVTLVSLCAAAFLGWPAFRACSRTPTAAITLLGGLRVLAEVVVLPALQLGNLQVSLADSASAMLLLAAVSRLAGETRRRVLLIWFVMVGLFLLALARGLLRSESAAPLEFSDQLVVIIGVLYGSTFRRQDVDWERLSGSIRRLAWFMLAALLIKRGGSVGTFEARTLTAASAFVIAQALLASLLDESARRSRSLRGVTQIVVFAGAVIVLQHRTVWVAVAVALVAYGLSSARAAVLGAGSVLTVMVLVIGMDMLGIQGTRDIYAGTSLVEQLQSAADNSNTLDWRTARWRATLETNAERGPVAVVAGAGYRANWVESGPQALRREPPHSQYVEIAVRYGVMGVALWVLLYVTTISNLRASLGQLRRWSPDHSLTVFLYVVVAAQLVLSISYSLPMIQPILLGLALGVAASSRGPRPVTAATVTRLDAAGSYGTNK